MTTNSKNDADRLWSYLRIAGWSAGALFLLLPLVAMQFTDEVKWGVEDFVFAAGLIVGTGIAAEIALRQSRNSMYRWAAAIGLGASFLLAWVSASVGIIGVDGDTANLMYLCVLLVGMGGALTARFKAESMVLVLSGMAITQLLVAIIAIVLGLGEPWSRPLEIALSNGLFVALFCVSALMFHASVQGESR